MSNIITPGDAETLILESDIVPVTVKSLTAAGGLVSALPGVYIGETYLVDKNSFWLGEFTLENGKTFSATCVWIVDGTGRRLGWMYAQMFFPTLEK